MADLPGKPVDGHRLGISVGINRVSKWYGPVAALDEVSIDIERGEFLTLLGPSGSGKTSLLMALAGFLDLDAGEIVAGGHRIDHLPPERRQFGMVFQGYALFPHLTVAENIAFPLKVRGTPKSEIRQRVDDVLDLVQLQLQKDRLPKQLSGGQQQRTALARAIVFEPGLLLLDEPLSALDKALREELQWEMKTFHRRVGVTFVYVTHDQGEALGLSDRIGVMRTGKLVQVDTPRALYDKPRTEFVAGFLGSANFIEGDIIESNSEVVTIEANGHRLTQAADRLRKVGERAIVAVRPEHLRILRNERAPTNQIRGTVSEVIFNGHSVSLRVQASGFGAIQVSGPRSTAEHLGVGDPVDLGWMPEEGILVERD